MAPARSRYAERSDYHVRAEGSGNRQGYEALDEVECAVINPDGENIWGIQFPPLRAGETEESNVLLERRKCGSREFLSLSSIELEVLRASGILTKLCARCHTTGPWPYETQGSFLVCCHVRRLARFREEFCPQSLCDGWFTARIN